jgi:PAS domain S-box-containing protein
MNKLSIKALIAWAFVLILAMALAATASVFFTDRLTREALARHERAVTAVAAETRASAEVAASHRELERAIALGTTLTLAVRVATFLIGLVLAVLVYRRVAQMVGATESFAGRIERGEFGTRFATEAGGETAALAAALNRMVERLQAAIGQAAATGRRLDFLVSAAPMVVYAAKPSGDYGATYISPNIRRLLGYAPEDFLGDSGFWANHIHPDDRAWVLAEQEKLFTAGRIEAEYRFHHADGSWRWMHDETMLVRDAAGAPLELVGSWFDVTARKQLEASLGRRDAILNAVAYGSARFLRAGEDASTAQWSLAVEAVLSHLGEATGASRMWIVENTRAAEGELRARPAHRWAQPEFAVPDEDPLFAHDISYQSEGMGVEALRLRRGELLQLRPRDLPEGVRARFERLHIRAQLRAPIALGQEWWGFMAIDDCVEERPWTETELEALRAAANLFGAAVAARTGREALRASLESLGSVLEKLKGQSAEIERQNAELARASRMKSEFLAAVTHELKTPLNHILGFADLLEAGIGGALSPEQKTYVGDILGAGRQLSALVGRLLDLAQIEAGKASFAPQAVDAGVLLRQSAAAHEAAAQARGIAIVVEAEETVALADPRLLRRLLDELVDNAVRFNREGGSVTLRASLLPSPRLRGEGQGERGGVVVGAEAPPTKNPPSTPSPLVEAGSVGRGFVGGTSAPTISSSTRGEGSEGGASAPTTEGSPRGTKAAEGSVGEASAPIREGSPSGPWIVIEVADSGPGIAAEDLPRLFQPFVQLDAALERRHGGVGIGLVLASRIAALHGGRLDIDCPPGAGCTFSLRLPAAETPT